MSDVKQLFPDLGAVSDAIYDKLIRSESGRLIVENATDPMWPIRIAAVLWTARTYREVDLVDIGKAQMEEIIELTDRLFDEHAAHVNSPMGQAQEALLKGLMDAGQITPVDLVEMATGQADDKLHSILSKLDTEGKDKN